VTDTVSSSIVDASFSDETTDWRLSTLQPTTGYEFEVQAQRIGDLSDWSAPQAFSTPESQTGTFNLQWRDTATMTVTTVTGITDLSYTLTGLAEGEGYEWRVLESTEENTSAWSGWSGFTTTAATSSATSVQMSLTGIPDGNHETVVLDINTQSVLYWGTSVWSAGVSSLEIAAAAGTNVHYYAIGATKGGLQRGVIQ